MAIEAGKEQRLKIHPPAVVLEGLLAAGELAGDSGRLVVGCGQGALELRSVQPEGGKRMSAAEYLRGRQPTAFH